MSPFFRFIKVDQKTERKTHSLTRKLKIDGIVIWVDPRARTIAVDRDGAIYGFSHFPKKTKLRSRGYNWVNDRDGEAMYYMGSAEDYQGWPCGSFRIIGLPRTRSRFHRWFNLPEVL